MHNLEVDPWSDALIAYGSIGTDVSSSKLLDAFNTFSFNGAQTEGLPAHDNHVLLSGLDFDGSTLGLAGYPAMCQAARSGSVNQAEGNEAITAAVVAHEMGHNFLFKHDGDTNSCATSGSIMQSSVGSTPPASFSSCSEAYLTTFLAEEYPSQMCLENIPAVVFGDPVCMNGFVEEGEDCDCGQADCSAVDSCCDGATCTFSTGVCSDTQPCCENCQFVASGEEHVCRSAINNCDIEEMCPGGTAECPHDQFFYPGTACTSATTSGTFTGACYAAKCHSLDEVCAHTVSQMERSTFDAESEACNNVNDECQFLACHVKGGEEYACSSAFQDPAKGGLYLSVPDGSPCLHGSDDVGVRTGFCFEGSCQRPAELAVVPACGNGGVDYGEECDCGVGEVDPDGCCDCTSCSLLTGKQCSSIGWVDGGLCCSAACQISSAETVCRATASECDVAETCTGTSVACPSDAGQPAGTSCTTDRNEGSTCFAGACIAGLDEQCTAFVGSPQKACPDSLFEMSAECSSLMCSAKDKAGTLPRHTSSKITS
jgi:hypothetical protein